MNPLVLLFLLPSVALGEILTPPYFNLAENRRIAASATCGGNVPQAEPYCQLVGANADGEDELNFTQIQV